MLYKSIFTSVIKPSLLWKLSHIFGSNVMKIIVTSKSFLFMLHIRKQKGFMSSNLTLFRMDLFGTVHGWRRRWAKKAPVSRYLTHNNTHPLRSSDISIFSPNISKFCCIKKDRYRLHFNVYFVILLAFFESLRLCS